MAKKYDQKNIFPNGSYEDVAISDYYSYIPVTLPFKKQDTSGGQKMRFSTIQYQFHTVLMYVRIFSTSYCFLLSKNKVVQNLEFRKIQFYRTYY
jgi:hypothetical protein